MTDTSKPTLQGQEYRSVFTLYSRDGKRSADVLEFQNGVTYLDEREWIEGTTFKTRHGGSLVGPFASPEDAEKFIIATPWFRGDTGMHFNFKKSSLLILAMTAVACSRVMFAFFHDPEGPNLLVVAGMAAVIYLISSAVYLSSFSPGLTGFKRSSATIFIQIFVATGFYFCLR